MVIPLHGTFLQKRWHRGRGCFLEIERKRHMRQFQNLLHNGVTYGLLIKALLTNSLLVEYDTVVQTILDNIFRESELLCQALGSR